MELRSEVRKDLERTQAELANYQGQQKAPQPKETGEKWAGWTELEISATRSKIQDLEVDLTCSILNAKSPLLEDLKAIGCHRRRAKGGAAPRKRRRSTR